MSLSCSTGTTRWGLWFSRWVRALLGCLLPIAALSGRECTEDQGGQRGLLYLLERKRYENAVRDASVFVVRTATRNATMHD